MRGASRMSELRDDDAAPGASSSTDNLQRLLDQIEACGDDGRITVREVVATLGARAFAPLLLAPSLALVSPLSTLPGMPTVLATLVGLVAVQMALGREALWLPRILLDRGLRADRARRAIRWMRPWIRRIDPWLNERLTVLTDRPGNLVALGACCVVALFSPVMEVVPFLTTLVAAAIALFALGIFVRDGVVVFAGYVLLGGAL